MRVMGVGGLSRRRGGAAVPDDEGGRPPGGPAGWARAVVLLLALSLSAPPIAAAEKDLRGDLEQLLEWFGGRFDNYWQARTDEAEEVEEPHDRIHSIFAPMDLPQVGEHVFYVQQYSDGDPDRIYRQRLYTFAVNDEEKAIELVIYALPDASAARDAHLDPSKLAGLKRWDLQSYPGCEVYWQSKGDHFVGFTKPGACRVESRRSGRTLLISDDLYLSADEIWIQDRAVDSEGNWVYGHKGGIPHKLRRVSFFECWAAAPKGEGEDGETEWDLWRPIELHNQGGEFALDHDDGRETKYTLQLFQAVYSGENTVPVLELAIREAGKDQSIAYAWTEPRSARIGVNLRYLQAGCKRR